MTKAHDYDNATKFTKYLGDYFQYITRSSSEVVALEQEIKHVRAYAEIQSIRFADRIRVHFQDIPDICKLAMVPRLILQPIVENAYQHGFEQMLENAQLMIEVELQILSDECSYIMIHVEDNGRGLTEQELKLWERKLQGNESPDEITGMLNVHRRMQLKYGPDFGLILAQGAAGGLRVTIKLPGGET
jgi:two-component system sensor histidine kinase YesM